eukprot:COSAG05_NODE_13620_length_423_cov_0.935185_2_plen_45_part_01
MNNPVSESEIERQVRKGAPQPATACATPGVYFARALAGSSAIDTG